MGRPSVTVVVPVHNGARTLAPLVARTLAVLPTVADRCEMVLVNDGSADDSWATIEGLAARDPRVRGLDLARNYGQQNATLCGIRHATCTVVVTMDDDLQHPPEVIPELLRRLAEGYDVVYGTPAAEPTAASWAALRQGGGSALRTAVGVPELRDAGAFRALRTELRDAFADYAAPRVALDLLLTWGTSRFASVRTPRMARAAGVPGYGPVALVALASRLVLQTSTRPLRAVTLIGVVLAVVALGGLAGVVPLVGGAAPGWLLALVVLAQALGLVVVAAYVAELHARLSGRPPYVVRRETARPGDSAPLVGATAGETAFRRW